MSRNDNLSKAAAEWVQIETVVPWDSVIVVLMLACAGPVSDTGEVQDYATIGELIDGRWRVTDGLVDPGDVDGDVVMAFEHAGPVALATVAESGALDAFGTLGEAWSVEVDNGSTGVLNIDGYPFSVVGADFGWLVTGQDHQGREQAFSVLRLAE